MFSSKRKKRPDGVKVSAKRAGELNNWCKMVFILFLPFYVCFGLIWQARFPPMSVSFTAAL